MTKEPVKFAVVGCGHIGKRHADMISENPGAQLVAVADIEASKAEDIAHARNVPSFYSITDMLSADIAIDVVNVCTPNGLHAEQSSLAIDRGCHVVCEKPMGLNKTNCEDLIYRALKQNKHVFVVMQNRYSPPAIWLRSVVDTHILGKIYMVKINCYWNRDDNYYKPGSWKGKLNLDGGPLFTQFSHFIDIMYWLFGDVKNIKARFDNFRHRHNTEFEDSGYVNFEFRSGGIGSINYSTALYDKNFESSITIIAENGTIKVGGQYMDKVEYCHIKDYTFKPLPPSNPPNDYGTYKGSAANHHFVIQNVIDTLNGQASATTNAMEGLKVVEIIERIYNQRKLKSMGL